MRIANQTPFLVGAKVTSRTPPRPEMTVIVRGMFVLSPSLPLGVPDGLFPLSQGALTGEVVREHDEQVVLECLYPGDFADFKLRPEVMARGICHPPKGHPAKEHTVRISVGTWSKAAPVVAVAPIPFGPIPESAPSRRDKMGKDYGPPYRATRAPFYSSDFDWSYFQAAPPDQWLDSLRGDEQVTFTNLHPEARSFSKMLPGLRVRAFVKNTRGDVREVPMRLDTLFADLTAERLYITFRGLTPVAEVDLVDVATVLVATEALTEAALPAAHYHAAIDAFERDPVDLDGNIPEHLRDLAKAVRNGEKGASPSGGQSPAGAPAEPAPDPLSGFIAQKLGHLAASEQARLRQAIATMLAMPVPQGTNLRDALAAAVRNASVPATAPPPTSVDAPRAPIGAALANVLERLAAASKTVERTGVSAAGIAPALALAADPRIQALDPSFKAAAAGPECLEPGADLHGRDLRGRDLSGMDLRGANLSDALLSGAKLRGTQLEGANLSRTALDGADLSGAHLAKANLTLACLAAATVDDADLRGAVLDRLNARKAQFFRANLAGAEGSSASFDEAVFTNAKLTDVSLREAVFDRAVLDGCDFARAQLPRCRFLNAHATKANFELATLSGASFAGADLCDARLIEANGKGVIFSRATLDRVDFRYAMLPESHFSEAHGDGVTFRAVDLREARFYRASFPRALFIQTNLFSADLCKARLPHAQFAGANLYDAKLIGADISACDFSNAITKRSTLEEA